MRVDPKDGTCRECGGELRITDADDATMTVECEGCGVSYEVETDAFNDGCMTYYVPFMAAKLSGEGDDDE
jgi:transcription elongation factor Elf1